MKLRTKILSTLLIVLTLSGSIGFSMHKMVCLESGNTQFSLSTFDCCSHEDHSKELLSSECCAINQFNLDFEDYTVSKSLEIENKNPQITAFISGLEFNNLHFSARNHISNYNLPPPTIELDYQVLFQSFLC